MRYALLIYSDESAADDVSPEEQEAVFNAYYEYDQEVRGTGVWNAGEALQPTPTATTVRVQAGETLTSDGPFAETKEQLGGFYILDCKDLDEAIEYAAKLPGAAYGSVEVRPVMEIPSMPA